MFENLGWIEILVFYGIAVGFGAWQYIKMDRELKQHRREREEAEAGNEPRKDEQDR